MKLRVKKSGEVLIGLMRKIGYAPHESNGSQSFVRRIHGGDYPRFHIYAEENENEFTINLHLDQKAPSYEGTRAHAGEYDGEIIEREAERIKKLLA